MEMLRSFINPKLPQHSPNFVHLGFPCFLKLLGPQMQTSLSFLSAAKPLSSPLRISSSLVTAPTTDPNSMAASGPKWAQKTITLPPQTRGCHLITPQVLLIIISVLSTPKPKTQFSQSNHSFIYTCFVSDNEWNQAGLVWIQLWSCSSLL